MFYYIWFLKWFRCKLWFHKYKVYNTLMCKSLSWKWVGSYKGQFKWIIPVDTSSLCPWVCHCVTSFCLCAVFAVNRRCRPGQRAEQEFEPDSLQPRHPPEDPEEKAHPIHSHCSSQNHYPENTQHGGSHGLQYLQTRSVCGDNKQAHCLTCRLKGTFPPIVREKWRR